MTLAPITGHANITNGSTTVTVTDLILTSLNCVQGAQVFLGGKGYFVASNGPTDTTHFSVERPIEEATATVTCSISPITAEMTQRIALSKQLQDYDARSVLIAQNEAGLSYIYSNSTTGDPAAGNVAFDNLTLPSITTIRINETGQNAQSMADRIGQWAIGDELTVRATDGSGRVTVLLTSVATDQGSYQQATLTYVGKSGTLAPGADVVIERIGKGAAGAAAILNGVELALAAGHTVVAGDKGKTLVSTAATSITLALTAAATLGAAFGFVAKAGAAGSVVIDPNGSETIDGAATLTLTAGQSALIYTNGTGWRSLFLSSTGIGGSTGSTDNRLLRSDGTGGVTAQGSAVAVDDSGNITGAAALTLSGLLTLSGGQIKFPATQNASSDANTLDDYEEGTYTPSIAPSGGAFTTASATGTYTKIGNCVIFAAQGNITSVGTGTGDLILGLPFALANNFCGSGRDITGGKAVTFSSGSSTTISCAYYDGSSICAAAVSSALAARITSSYSAS